jgi:hypothetical protein
MTLLRLLAAGAALTAAFCAINAQTTSTMPTISFNPETVAASAPETKADATPEPLTATKAFSDAPATVFPSIDRMTRLDMIDYYNSGSPKPSKNAFKGDCRILSASDSQITVATSKVSEVELSLLTQGRDTLLMVVTTLNTPVPDSSVKFYTARWKEIDKGLFMVPMLDDWTLPEAKERKKDLEFRSSWQNSPTHPKLPLSPSPTTLATSFQKTTLNGSAL